MVRDCDLGWFETGERPRLHMSIAPMKGSPAVGHTRRALYGAGLLVAVLAALGCKSPTFLDHVDSLLDRAQGARGINQATRYLNGNFAPVAFETSPPTRLRVVAGALPVGLSAVIVRVGPNPIAEHGACVCV
jgi:hypothetical protein